MPEKYFERWKYRKVFILNILTREIRGCPVLRGAHFQHSQSSLWKKSELTALAHLGADTLIESAAQDVLSIPPALHQWLLG